MIRIQKTKEPASWTEHRLTEGAQYEATDDLRNALLKDQGYICAYCMRRIPTKDNGTNETSRIEHIVPQSLLSREDAMDFSNMVICCPGAISSAAENLTHCDRHKGEKTISFSPFDQHFIDTLSYRNDGTIVSSDESYDKEIDTILNLNIPLLKENRKRVKNSLISAIGKNGWTKGNLAKILKRYSEKDDNGHYEPYCGIIIWYITRKLKQTTK